MPCRASSPSLLGLASRYTPALRTGSATRPTRPTRSLQRPAWRGTGVLAVSEHLDAINEDVANARRILHRLFESRAIGDCRRVEQDHIRSHSRRQTPAVSK